MALGLISFQSLKTRKAVLHLFIVEYLYSTQNIRNQHQLDVFQPAVAWGTNLNRRLHEYSMDWHLFAVFEYFLITRREFKKKGIAGGQAHKCFIKSQVSPEISQMANISCYVQICKNLLAFSRHWDLPFLGRIRGGCDSPNFLTSLNIIKYMSWSHLLLVAAALWLEKSFLLGELLPQIINIFYEPPNSIPEPQAALKELFILRLLYLFSFTPWASAPKHNFQSVKPLMLEHKEKTLSR